MPALSAPSTDIPVQGLFARGVDSLGGSGSEVDKEDRKERGHPGDTGHGKCRFIFSSNRS